MRDPTLHARHEFMLRALVINVAARCAETTHYAVLVKRSLVSTCCAELCAGNAHRKRNAVDALVPLAIVDADFPSDAGGRANAAPRATFFMFTNSLTFTPHAIVMATAVFTPRHFLYMGYIKNIAVNAP